jgi:hypothetical protein
VSPTRYFREGRRLQAALVFAFIFFAIGFGYYGVVTSRNTTARLALCALRHDKQHELETSVQFLRDHPHGIRGIPAALIRDGIRNSKRTLKALRILECP